jgi:sugar lactone lactonase YvrE
MRLIKRSLLLLLMLLVALGVTLKLRYGGGADFPDRAPGPPRLPESALELVAELPTPPGNVAVSRSGRVFVTLHPEARPALKVVELVDGQMRPFPSQAFQDGLGEPRFFRDVLSLRIDRQNRLWTLDNGQHGLHRGRLLAFDLDSGAVVHEYHFPRSVAGLGSHLNDFQVSADGQFIYIAEASFFAQTPALVVYDVAQGQARRVLEGHPSVVAEAYTPVVQGRRMEVLGLVSIRPGVDSIALSRDGEWLYFAPVTNLHLYRIATRHLRDARLGAAELAGRVEVHAPKTMSDGITTDAAGNVYLSDLEHSRIVVLRPDKTLETLVQSPQLRWPDGFSFGPEGSLYVSCSALHQVLGRLPSQIARAAPYPLYRIRTGAQAEPGH